MSQTARQGYSPTHDPVLLGVVGFLAGIGTVLAYLTEWRRTGVVLVYLLVAVLIVIWTIYLRARPPEEPPAG